MQASLSSKAQKPTENFMNKRKTFQKDGAVTRRNPIPSNMGPGVSRTSTSHESRSWPTWSLTVFPSSTNSPLHPACRDPALFEWLTSQTSQNLVPLCSESWGLGLIGLPVGWLLGQSPFLSSAALKVQAGTWKWVLTYNELVSKK